MREPERQGGRVMGGERRRGTYKGGVLLGGWREEGGSGEVRRRTSPSGAGGYLGGEL